MRCSFILLLVAACSSQTSSNKPEAISSTSVGAAPDALRKKLCSSPCTGKYARLTAFVRPSDGHAAIYRFEGDLSTCSHPPYIYFDGNGKQVYAVGNYPVSGPDESKKLAAELDSVIGGLTEGGHQSCDVAQP
jgi:hypothetical protein